ncbi:MAG: DnaD domain protein [Ruminococcus sp.]|jgi:DnaD/phage-associated family protein
MNQLTVYNHCGEGFTAVSNRFLDEYMPKANGEFVKIYLYLLRAVNISGGSLTLSSIADTFDCTENDVERALRYWSKQHLIQMAVDSQNQITELTLLPLPSSRGEDVSSVSLKSEREKTAPSKSNIPLSPSQYVLTPDMLKELRQKEDVMQLLFIAEQYLGKTLSPTETARILYFYQVLHFSADLIEYLIEYCVSKGSKSIRYMEKVALSWAESGITTVEMAKQETNTFHREYFTVLKAFGISNRNPVDSEIQMINHWRKDYGFTTDIILEACSRTVSQTGKASFQYADGILSAWNQKGVKSFSDISRLDASHREKQAARAAKSTPGKSSNKFNNFHQRDYNFSDLERQLLKK